MLKKIISTTSNTWNILLGIIDIYRIIFIKKRFFKPFNYVQTNKLWILVE